MSVACFNTVVLLLLTNVDTVVANVSLSYNTHDETNIRKLMHQVYKDLQPSFYNLQFLYLPVSTYLLYFSDKAYVTF